MVQARLAEIEQRCREQGLALTIQRRVILQELLGRKDHPSADQIFESVSQTIPGLSRATVYRVLETMVQLGAARKVSHAGAVVRYDPNTDRHHHLICDTCGDLVDVEAGEFADIPVPKTGTAGFQITDFSINFSGLCSTCQAH